MCNESADEVTSNRNRHTHPCKHSATVYRECTTCQACKTNNAHTYTLLMTPRSPRATNKMKVLGEKNRILTMCHNCLAGAGMCGHPHTHFISPAMPLSPNSCRRGRPVNPIAEGDLRHYSHTCLRTYAHACLPRMLWHWVLRTACLWKLHQLGHLT